MDLGLLGCDMMLGQQFWCFEGCWCLYLEGSSTSRENRA